jgi:hypothetical protein
VLELIETRISPEVNERLAAEPDDEEILRVICAMKKEKAPGIDRITAEMLLSCWDFLGSDCCAVIHEFWRSRKLSKQLIAAIIKLIPKGGAQQFLKKWRPISLLNVPYKVIAKLLANRLKCILPELINIQQTGFIQGRSIQDNILTLKLVQEKVIREKKPIAMLQIDFKKAYDRVDHHYIWEFMRKFGFAEEYIELVQGLVEGGTAKVHFNGLFTGRFQLARGVRQGCPLAPLLYSLITQPLDTLLKERTSAGLIQGINIQAEQQLVCQLFEDNTGIFFEAMEASFRSVMEVLHDFELISGAKVNLEKSKLIQLDNGEQPEWFVRSGCTVVGDGQLITYLGCPFGRRITQQQEIQFILRKMRSRLRHWTNRLLPMPGKLILMYLGLENMSIEI